MNMEKVAKGLERCLSFDPSCGDCPYYSCDDMYNECERNLKNDVLAMLREQETKFICNLLGGQPYEVYCRECRTIVCQLSKGDTMDTVKRTFNFCPQCGRVVKWNDV